MQEMLDKVESYKGDAILVTIGSGKKFFSSGFDMKMFAESKMVLYESISKGQKLFKRILTIGVPTLCVLNGHAVAGGLFYALCNDFTIMRDDDKIVANLPEINLSLPIPLAYTEIVKNALTPKEALLLCYGARFTPK